MLCEQPAIRKLRQVALDASHPLSRQLSEVAEDAEFEVLYYAVEVHKGFEAAQKHFRQYSQMEEKRLLAFEPAIREHDDRHDPKDRRMEASFTHAVELAREAVHMYVVKE